MESLMKNSLWMANFTDDSKRRLHRFISILMFSLPGTAWSGKASQKKTLPVEISPKLSHNSSSRLTGTVGMIPRLTLPILRGNRFPFQFDSLMATSSLHRTYEWKSA
jgi:hypothetical protein